MVEGELELVHGLVEVNLALESLSHRFSPGLFDIVCLS